MFMLVLMVFMFMVMVRVWFRRLEKSTNRRQESRWVVPDDKQKLTLERHRKSRRRVGVGVTRQCRFIVQIFVDRTLVDFVPFDEFVVVELEKR